MSSLNSNNQLQSTLPLSPTTNNINTNITTTIIATTTISAEMSPFSRLGRDRGQIAFLRREVASLRDGYSRLEGELSRADAVVDRLRRERDSGTLSHPHCSIHTIPTNFVRIARDFGERILALLRRLCAAARTMIAADVRGAADEQREQLQLVLQDVMDE